MKNVLKWLGIVVGILVGLVVIAAATIYGVTEYRSTRAWNVKVASVTIPTDAASVKWGEHVAVVRGCVDCHGANLGGKIFIEDPAVGRLISVNLTSGKGGIGKTFSDTDLVRAIRHGVDPSGRSVWFMPAQEFYYLSDTDLGALIAYLRSVPPVDNELPKSNLAFLIRTIYLLTGEVALFPAELINHDAPRPVAPPVGVTADYGKYLAVGCTGCHGTGFGGGAIPGAPPSFPPAINITPGGEIQGWSEADFVKAMRTGVNPGGRQLNNDYMPWKIIGQMTDDELKAVLLYLRSLPKKEQGSR
ncbi:MAG: c-type cytochrome [Chloroflexi bacterium]|nr:c-type cytochrome [Chloroflexota bacterium]